MNFINNIKTRGFSLIEISVVLLIIASMIGGGLMFFNEYRDRNKRLETVEKMRTIQEKIKDFAQTYYRLPCPADITLPLNDAGISPDPDTCISNPTIIATLNDGNTPFTSGMVPFKSLGLSEDYAIDGWGNRIRYLIASRNSREDVFTDQLQSDADFIFGNFATDSATPQTSISQGILFVLFSHGENGIGAVGARGQTTELPYSDTSTNILNILDDNGNTTHKLTVIPEAGSLDGAHREMVNNLLMVDSGLADPRGIFYVSEPIAGFDDIVMGMNYTNLMRGKQEFTNKKIRSYTCTDTHNVFQYIQPYLSEMLEGCCEIEVVNVSGAAPNYTILLKGYDDGRPDTTFNMAIYNIETALKANVRGSIGEYSACIENN